MFLGSLPKGSRGFSYIGGTAICLAFPVIDNILLLFEWDFVFRMHQHGFEGVYPFETNLYSSVFEDLLEGLTQARKIRY